MKTLGKRSLACALLVLSSFASHAASWPVEGGGYFNLEWDSGSSTNKVAILKLLNNSGYTVNDIHLIGKYREELKSFSFADTPSKDEFNSGMVTDRSVIDVWFELERSKVVGAYWTYNGKTVPPVPEPEAMGLALAGIAVAAALRRHSTRRN